MSPTVRDIRAGILDQTLAQYEAARVLRHATDAERMVLALQIQEIKAMRTELDGHPETGA